LAEKLGAFSANHDYAKMLDELIKHPSESFKEDLDHLLASETTLGAIVRKYNLKPRAEWEKPTVEGILGHVYNLSNLDKVTHIYRSALLLSLSSPGSLGTYFTNINIANGNTTLNTQKLNR
jgi:hypothetical protein